ncbi:MAG: bifunctional DNA-formamidopyrimidine glycosylase/DNA-(apurinic or apyrimidinic site) lyase [Alphaproteobacteria bacterium]|nr:bifunctional DNA-formamidopyrimidine glycosylase/DNA-(apurinic or apyrimidinic site) lyase [Alphaproteobacteria bacterium]
MPELPEVETVVRGLKARIEGKRLLRLVLHRADLRQAVPTGLAAKVENRRVVRIDRRAKYILMHLADGGVLIAHLGMSGRLTLGDSAHPAPPRPHDHAVMDFEDGIELRFNDPRRFGLIDYAREDTLRQHKLFAHLGPEPLAKEFDGALLARLIEGKRTPIKAALLDQRVVVGIGNIYACESLYWARLSPKRLARTVRGSRADALARAIKRVLEHAIAAGGSSLRDYVDATGELGNFQRHFAVYDRAGERCPGCDCRSFIKRIVQSGRSTFYCAKRQR